jgi:predicted transposase YdaD
MKKRLPNKRMRQVVIYLTPSTSELVYQTAFEIPATRHEFEVIRLWEQPTQPFLEATGLLPLAVLTQTPDKAQTLRQVASRIEAIPELRMQSNVAASAGILAGLVLKRGFINQVLRRDIMRESVIYQDIKEEDRQDEARSLILKLLTRRVGTIPPEAQAQIEVLSLEQLEALGEALLDFAGADDLRAWLQGHQ